MPEFNKIIHEHSRLLILTHLASNTDKEISFNDMQEKLNFTSGNLSAQLKKLSEVDYLKIRKSFRNNKPHTSIIITPKGINALKSYLEEMKNLIKRLGM